jgi:hypothetical protein
MNRLRSERGSSSAIEIIGMLPLLIFAGLAAWQVLLVGFVATGAENAARTASRVMSLEQGSPEQAARQSLSPGLRPGTRVAVGPGETRVSVTVDIPLLLPRMSSGLSISRSAELPPRSR